MKKEILELKIDKEEVDLSYKDYSLFHNTVRIKKLKENNISIEDQGSSFVIKYIDKTKPLSKTWASIISSLIIGIKEPYEITLEKTFRKRFEFYHKFEDRAIIVSLFEKQKKPILISYSNSYFAPLEISINENQICFKSYSKEILGNGVSKLLKLRKGKLLRKDLRKFITGYVRV